MCQDEFKKKKKAVHTLLHHMSHMSQSAMSTVYKGQITQRALV